MPFPKPCKKCDKKFTPKTPHNKLCDECYYKGLIERTDRLRKVRATPIKKKEIIKHPNYICDRCDKKFHYKYTYDYHRKGCING